MPRFGEWSAASSIQTREICLRFRFGSIQIAIAESAFENLECLNEILENGIGDGVADWRLGIGDILRLRTARNPGKRERS